MKQYYKFLFDSSQKYKLISFYLIIRLFVFRKLSFLGKKYYNQYISLNSQKLDFKKDGRYTQDWFSYNIKYISRILFKYELQNKKLNILELGSYEGLSTVFFLTMLKHSNIYCVDPFVDFEENKDKDFNKVYENFKYNTQKFENRIRLSKSTSDNFFEKGIKEKFDLIYIDGNHLYDFVKKDISNSLNFINKEGIIVLDDYKLKGWWNDGVTRAIDYFIKTKKIKILEQHNLINYHHQCILQKI